MVTNVSQIKHIEMDNGLRILARMIARAHLKEACRKQSEIACSQDQKMEGSNVNKRRI